MIEGSYLFALPPIFVTSVVGLPNFCFFFFLLCWCQWDSDPERERKEIQYFFSKDSFFSFAQVLFSRAFNNILNRRESFSHVIFALLTLACFIHKHAQVHGLTCFFFFYFYLYAKKIVANNNESCGIYRHFINKWRRINKFLWKHAAPCKKKRGLLAYRRVMIYRVDSGCSGLWK